MPGSEMWEINLSFPPSFVRSPASIPLVPPSPLCYPSISPSLSPFPLYRPSICASRPVPLPYSTTSASLPVLSSPLCLFLHVAISLSLFNLSSLLWHRSIHTAFLSLQPPITLPLDHPSQHPYLSFALLSPCPQLGSIQLSLPILPFLLHHNIRILLLSFLCLPCTLLPPSVPSSGSSTSSPFPFSSIPIYTHCSLALHPFPSLCLSRYIIRPPILPSFFLSVTPSSVPFLPSSLSSSLQYIAISPSSSLTLPALFLPFYSPLVLYRRG